MVRTVDNSSSFSGAAEKISRVESSYSSVDARKSVEHVTGWADLTGNYGIIPWLLLVILQLINKFQYILRFNISLAPTSRLYIYIYYIYTYILIYDDIIL